jgi:hypothetical protein
MASTSSPLIANGVLYAAINSGLLSAFDPTTGGTLWSTTIGSIHWESPLVANGAVYLAGQNAHLTAFAFVPDAAPASRSPFGPNVPGTPGISPVGRSVGIQPGPVSPAPVPTSR